MTFRKALTRRAFALAGAVVAARGGLVPPQRGYAQDAEGVATSMPYTTPVPPPDPVPVPSALQVQDAYTFLVAGMDTRGAEDAENTDVIMLSRVDVLNNRMRTISIPRDLLAEIPGVGWLKINAAYNIASKANNFDWNAGVDLFRRTIEWNFNFKVDGVVTTNLLKMPGVVDTIGGITVINPYDVVDETYPTADFGTKAIFYPEGELRLNGEQALEFSRTRHMDFDEGRVMRQRIVLSACLDELQKPANVTRIPQLVEAGREFVATDIPADVQGHLVASLPMMNPELVEWGTVVEFLWGETLADGGWNYMTDWSFLPAHVRGWLGIGPLDLNRP